MLPILSRPECVNEVHIISVDDMVMQWVMLSVGILKNSAGYMETFDIMKFKLYGKFSLFSYKF